MSRPEELRQVTEKTLYGLTADDSLKCRILQKASCSTASKHRFFLRPVPVLCTVFAALLAAVIALNTLQAVPSAGPVEIKSFIAGNIIVHSSLFPDGFDPYSVISVTVEGSGTVTDPEQCRMLISVLQDYAVPAESDALSDHSTLEITEESGGTFTFDVCNPYLSDEDHQVWSCPEFFSSFDRIIE